MFSSGLLNMDEVEEVLEILSMHDCNEIEDLYTLGQKHCLAGAK
tara:strand:- start:7568 stop:7699 length:132 start_codon:yes stop_codon:yes gene_type:complete